MEWVANLLQPLWEIFLSWFRGPPAPTAIGGGVISNRDIKIKKATKNLTAKIETECGSNSSPSEKENDAGQGPSARKIARDAGVINNDNICIDDVDGDVDLSISAKKVN